MKFLTMRGSSFHEIMSSLLNFMQTDCVNGAALARSNLGQPYILARVTQKSAKSDAVYKRFVGNPFIFNPSKQ